MSKFYSRPSRGVTGGGPGALAIVPPPGSFGTTCIPPYGPRRYHASVTIMPPPPTDLPWGAELPLVGRTRDLGQLREALTQAAAGRGQSVLLTGEAGVGKTRLLAAVARDAAARGMLVAAGSAFAIEAGVPYAAFADTLTRTLRSLDAATITAVARGAERDLLTVLPGLAGVIHGTPADHEGDAAATARVWWNVTQFLLRLAARRPLVLLLDNAGDGDASSLELLHALAKQLRDARILLVLAYVDDAPERNPVLRNTVRALTATHAARVQPVERLTPHDLQDLLVRALDLPPERAARHADALWTHTLGNAFFLDETLKALLASGAMTRGTDGWLLHDMTPQALPHTVRDAVVARLESLDPDARRLADLAALLDARATLPLLDRAAGLTPTALADAVDTLCARRLLVERRADTDVSYEFTHPIVQATVRSLLTAPRERVLHGTIAAAIESLGAVYEPERAAMLARHLLRSEDRRDEPRTIEYLLLAGRDALARRADADAAHWLRDALTLQQRCGCSERRDETLDLLATASLRRGDTAAAIAYWQQALDGAVAQADHASQAGLLHQLAQVAARTGDASRGLRLLDDAACAADAGGREDLAIRIGVTRAKLLQALGRHADATAVVQQTLTAAAAAQNPLLLARAHQTALQLYAWTGPVATAHAHGAQAVALAEMLGDRTVAWSAHWAMAMLAGFTGDVERMAGHLGAATALADAIASPALQALTAEISIEYASGIGQWDEALAIAERNIPLARAVLPQSLLPRLLVWTGLIVLERDETERARALLQEAWQRSGAALDVDDAPAGDDTLGNVHNVILAHTGMGALMLADGDWSRALDFGERGLALADRFGYVAWAIHRLIPQVIEAALRTQDYARVAALTARLREQSTQLGHRLGLAWATAADALVARVQAKAPDAAQRLIAAADALDAVPFVFHAARIRRNAAQVMEADGDIAGATRELRRVHDVFARLGAERELRGVRQQMRALGARLPTRTVATGAGVLTPRERDIARAVARRLTNKEIGAAFDISSRTVSTHLSNIFAKLGVDSRGALADAVRADPQLRDD
jgi:predicted ATPase/DNA-binding NarL/FixJ family response regulator